MSAAPTYNLITRFPTQEEQRDRYDGYIHSREQLHQAEVELRRAEERLAADPDNEELGGRVDELQRLVDSGREHLDVALANYLGVLVLPEAVRDSEVVVAVMGERRRPVPELI